MEPMLDDIEWDEDVRKEVVSSLLDVFSRYYPHIEATWEQVKEAVDIIWPSDYDLEARFVLEAFEDEGMYFECLQAETERAMEAISRGNSSKVLWNMVHNGRSFLRCLEGSDTLSC